MLCGPAPWRDLFGIDLPIVQAPMAGAQDHALTIAVSEAGGLGALPAAALSPEALEQALTAIRAATRKPYLVNAFCHRPAPPDREREQRWRQRLAPFYREYGIDPEAIPTAPSRRPFDAGTVEVLAAFEPPILSFHFGLPDSGLLARLKRWQPLILATATTLDEARWLEAQGVDAIIAQGLEAGGHRGHFLQTDLSGQLPLRPLLASLVRSVRVPVIAAGGIADADGVRAILGAGASAVQVGTAYLFTPEARISAIHRRALAQQPPEPTEITNLFSGRPARGIRNRLMRELEPLCPDAPGFPLAGGALAPLRNCAEQTGSGDFSPLWAGTNRAACRVMPAAALTRQLAAVAQHD